jgi:predicted amidophosphoribosyltransferase
MFNPKLMLIVALVVAIAGYISWLFYQILQRFLPGKFTCKHCKHNFPDSEKDLWFADEICKNCGANLVPLKNRAEEI